MAANLVTIQSIASGFRVVKFCSSLVFVIAEVCVWLAKKTARPGP
jgi:hypothetical protein